MQVVSDPRQFTDACAALRASGGFGFVPTMGALHEGHLQLLRHARELTGRSVASIFVNPTQFGPNEDLAKYPRDLERDVAACESVGVDLVFTPTAATMYPAGEQTRVLPGELAKGLCGASRPGHFAGVCTVLAKFFHLTGPCTAIFGRKDYQQFRVVERMARDLFFPIHVVGYPIVREADGLAMSSRNRYLSESERARALTISQSLKIAQASYAAGERSAQLLVNTACSALTTQGLEIDYVQLVDPNELIPVSGILAGPALLAIAVFSGRTRLIDNAVLGEPAAWVDRGGRGEATS
jgi:pantoate--beta-alanine ligase